MFKFNLQTSFRCIAFHDNDGNIRFDPPVYEQRYSTVISILEQANWAKQLHKVRSIFSILVNKNVVIIFMYRLWNLDAPK